jgi:hypothetical protein
VLEKLFDIISRTLSPAKTLSVAEEPSLKFEGLFLYCILGAPPGFFLTQPQLYRLRCIKPLILGVLLPRTQFPPFAARDDIVPLSNTNSSWSQFGGEIPERPQDTKRGHSAPL